jgi:hypothetical protein
MSLASLGTGMKQFGGQIAGFGLEMLKLGISEEKAKKIQDTLQEYENWLNTQDITPEEKDTAIQTAKNEAVAGAEEAGEVTQTPEARPATRGQAEIGLSLLKGEAPPATGSAAKAPVSTELAPGQPLTKKPISRAITPYSQRASNLETAISGPQGQAYRKKITEAGGSQADIATIEERPRARITAGGKAALEKDISERELEIKQEQVGISALKEKRLTKMATAQSWFNTNKIRIADEMTNLKKLALRMREGQLKGADISSQLAKMSTTVLTLNAMKNNWGVDEDGTVTPLGQELGPILDDTFNVFNQILEGYSGDKQGNLKSLLFGYSGVTDQTQLAGMLQKALEGGGKAMNTTPPPATKNPAPAKGKGKIGF